eukprot:m.134323 g.134323  ORF g.134323 m.134323 type:complete len:115 (+) comp16913_c0_seq6:278-622(+)
MDENMRCVGFGFSIVDPSLHKNECSLPHSQGQRGPLGRQRVDVVTVEPERMIFDGVVSGVFAVAAAGPASSTPAAPSSSSTTCSTSALQKKHLVLFNRCLVMHRLQDRCYTTKN